MCNWWSILAIFVSIRMTQIQGASLRVIGGEIASPEHGLYHASLQNLTGHHVCGGAVISTRHIITAAHCVYEAKPQYIKVIVGTTDLDKNAENHDVKWIHIYKGYNYTLKTNDIAIIKIKGMFNEKRIIKIYKNELKEGDNLTLTGFGAVEPNGESSRKMHLLHVPVFNQDTCKYAMRYFKDVTDTMFCTFTRIGEGTCHGDSGGPLVKDNQLVGVVSWGIPCAAGFPDVHMRITPYLPWIKSVIKPRSVCPTRTIK